MSSDIANVPWGVKLSPVRTVGLATKTSAKALLSHASRSSAPQVNPSQPWAPTTCRVSTTRHTACLSFISHWLLAVGLLSSTRVKAPWGQVSSLHSSLFLRGLGSVHGDCVCTVLSAPPCRRHSPTAWGSGQLWRTVSLCRSQPTLSCELPSAHT